MNIKDICQNVHALRNILPTSRLKRLRKIFAKESWTPSNKETVINELSQLMMKKKHTLVIAEQLSPILLELLVHIERKIVNKIPDHKVHEEIRLCIALGYLVSRFPDAARFCYQFIQQTPTLFAEINEGDSDEPPEKRTKRKTQSWNRDDLLMAALKFLCFDTDCFKKILDWSCLVPLMEDSNDDIRWMACLCIAVVTGMPEQNRRQLLCSKFSEDIFQQHVIRNYDLLRTLFPAQVHLLSRGELGTSQSDDSHYCPSVVSVAGVLLLRCEEFNTKPSVNLGIVEVPSVRQILCDVAMAISIGRPVLLEGPVGSGKTTLVEHLAAVTSRELHVDLIKVQLGDQTDSKTLVGNYCCTDIPGEFVWRAGPLTEAMEKGKWLLLEDIDSAPLDVISLLIGVLENGTLNLPGYAQALKAKNGFQIFVTRRLLPSFSGVHSEGNSFTDLLNKLWKRVRIEVPSRLELERIIVTKWSNLKPIVERILDIYYMVSSLGQRADDQQPIRSRLVSARDLYKWCQRASDDFNLWPKEIASFAFLDALDCFCGSITHSSQKLPIATAIGEKLNHSKEKVNFYCTTYKPEIDAKGKTVVIGRTFVEKKESEDVRFPQFL